MANCPIHPFENLSWRRLRFTLQNIRRSVYQQAKPVSTFQSIIKGVTTSFGSEDSNVIFHLQSAGHHNSYQHNDVVEISVFFCGSRNTDEFVKNWRISLQRYFNNPTNSRNFRLIKVGVAETRTLNNLLSESGGRKPDGEVCLEFVTPLSFTPVKEKQQEYLDKPQFIQMLEKRIEKLFGQKISYVGDPQAFQLLPYYWEFDRKEHKSKSQEGETKWLKGCLGKLFIKGDFSDLWPWLLLAGELHMGQKPTYAAGYCLVHVVPVTHFYCNFPNQQAMLQSVQDVLERFDNAAASLAATEVHPFSADTFAENLCRELVLGTYHPTPAVAVAIPKKDGSERIIEPPRFRDMVIQQYLQRLLAPVLERMFEASSIGYRRGIDRMKAVELFKQARDEGYCYVIESDIEDFFPSVDHHLLLELLHRYLPQADAAIVDLVMRCVKTPYLLNGALVERIRGLSQGSPLSPMLSNLFLDSFDEVVQTWDVRMIRYADDFIIMTRSRDEAEKVLEQVRQFLGGLNLGLNTDKTSICHACEGFSFLGIHFDAEACQADVMQDSGRLRKPLYITEPYVFVALNGESVEILKEQKVIQSFPIRRISEIIVMDKASFSTALVRKCADFAIPLTMTLNSGYYVATIKPDSKKYFTISYEQARRYYALSATTEHLMIAKEFAKGKLRNYCSFLKQRYEAGMNHLLHELEERIEEINQAVSVEQVRGYEGIAARSVYAYFRALLDGKHQDAFSFKTRNRKAGDRMNAFLNFAYYLLFSWINTTVRSLGLNPYLGFLHSDNNNYESLVCDIEELFRARIDRLVIRCINTRIIKPDDFYEKEGRYLLSRDGMKKFIAEFENELERKNAKNELSLKEEIHVQCQRVKDFFLRDDASLTYYSWKV